ncbi:MAG: DUF177 domain-containing protein [Bacilli bacterium]|nr:DUF177 domain-containing protein [Bacilli bacterium]
MVINRVILPLNKTETFCDNIDFSSQHFDDNHVRRIERCSVKVDATEYGDVLRLQVNGEANVIASCSYTLEDVPLKVKFKDEFFFSSEEDNSQDCYFEPSVNIDLDPHILALILSEVPHNITKSGASLPKSGDGYRVLSEDDYLQEKKNKKNSAFDILDTIEFDENN